MTNKDAIFARIVDLEGADKYTNHPDDAGGPTRWGVTQKVARAHGYQGDMRKLTRAEALAILEADYWFGPRFDQVEQVNVRIAEKLCDTGVNMGPATQVSMLQRWLNAFNEKDTLYPTMLTDGGIGPRTLAALRLFLVRRGAEGEGVLLKGLNCTQGTRYLELAEKSESNKSFVYGWVRARITV